jgi:O-antigen/teichoic acid export membrane protein
MLRSIFHNIAISAGAFLAVSIVGLLLVPILIGAYGIVGFGTIVLARLFLPTAAMGVLDFGFGETATQAIARARSDGDWARGCRLLRMSALVAACIGAVAGLALLVFSPSLPAWLRVAPNEQQSMQLVLQVTAALLPLQFISLVLEGIIKGFERFSVLRSIEVVAALSYAALVLVVVHSDGSVYMACYAFMVSLLIRSTIASIFATVALRPHWKWMRGTTLEEQGWFFTMTRNMAVNKVLGASQTQLAPLLIGLFFGPAGAGTYEALSRLPRAIKSVLGLLSTTVLPVAARLESAADTRGMQRLGQAGILIVGVVAMPPVLAAMVFSKPLLYLWIGSELADLWAWQALMFLIPAMTVLLSFGGTALLVRSRVTSIMNRWTALQVFVQFLFAVVAAKWLSERAFILGQVLAVAMTFVPQLRLVCSELGVSRAVLQRLLNVIVALVVQACLVWFIVPFITTWTLLVLGMLLLTMLGWITGFRLGLIPEQRKRLRTELHRCFRLKKGE